jgi:hypothetical protein
MKRGKTAMFEGETKSGRAWTKRLSVVLLAPIMLSGCCTFMTTDFATHTERSDSVQSIEKAAISTNHVLMLLVQGRTAESSRTRPLTVTASILEFPSSENSFRLGLQSGAEGWDREFFNDPNVHAVAIGPRVTLSAFEHPETNQGSFLEVPGAERIVYLVQTPKPYPSTYLYYVETGQPSHTVCIFPERREIRTPERYPLLLLVPVTIPIDLVTMPIQAPLFWW